MPGFDPTILRDEEKAGGFEPGLAGDDTFKLEQLPAYPGTAQTPVPAVQETAPAETSEVELPIEIEAEPTAFIPKEPVEERRAVPDEPKAALVDTTAASYSEPLVLDDSLIALLKEDLNKSKERKRVEEEAEIPEPSTVAADTGFDSYTNYADVAAAAGGQEIEVDLSNIGATHPSTYGIEQPKQTEQPTATATGEKVGSESQKPEKKRRSISRTAVLALLLLLILGGAAGGAYYYFFFAPGHGHTAANSHDSTSTESAEHAKAETGGHAAESAHATEHEAATHGAGEHDTAAQHAMAHTEPRQIPIDTAVIREHTGGIPASTHSQSQSGHAQQPNTEHSIAAGTSHGSTETSGQHAGTSDKHQTSAVAAPHGGAADKHQTNAAAQHTGTTDKTHNSADKTAATASRTEKTSRAAGKQSSASAKSAANQEYVIQVYASPSADDADEWLGTLKKRNIPNGFVTSQSVRGQTWYRVRFGSFSTREEAEKRATELGLSNIWVVRTR